MPGIPWLPTRNKTSRPSLGLFLILMGLLVPLLIAACSSDDPTAVVQPTATYTPPPPAQASATDPTSTSDAVMEITDASMEVSNQGSVGPHLVNADGMSLYLFTNDERNISNCSGGCAEAWPPLLTLENTFTGDGMDPDRVGTIQRDDGSNQVTYNGKPLYYYASDEKTGDTLGQDRGDVWFLVSPDGGPIRTAASVVIEETEALGKVLTDLGGNTLYLYTKDERNVSNCAGGCALAWPPLVTVEDPVVGEGLDEGRIGTISRGDGVKQVTYNGWPLYYLAADEKPGDTNGQDRGDVWFGLSPYGGAVYTQAQVNTVANDDLGTILTDATGRSLYLYTKDERNVAHCNGGCAQAWPPVITIDEPLPGEGLNSDRIGVTEREDGSSQVTYNGWPLYYFAADDKPGDTNGQDRGGVWFVLTTDGSAVYTNAPVNATTQVDNGTILTDAAGRSLYLYTKDERNVSNCTEGCALAWPPLITVEDPVSGEGLDADRIGVTERADGSSQVTYNGWPLYYFAADETPGDALGQDRGGVWFVVTTDGSAIYPNAPVNSAVNAELGTILTDAAGRSLYLYTPDEPNISNCSGGCALAWPPLITVADPVAGEGVSSPLLGTTNREDGTVQVTYDGDPLYYFAADEKPGDTLGQNRGDVWFVISLAESTSLNLGALKDDTLFETSNGEFNNGAGQWVFAGQTGGALVRRGLYAFDIAGQVPAGVTVTGVSLTLNMSRTLAGDIDIGLHRVLSDWQEGVGQGFGNEGAGISAVTGDVTWTDRALGSELWEDTGGDFTSDASATAVVGDIGSYTWDSTSTLVADVQSWLDDPDSNFGWLVLGDETGNQTAKRFDSRENEEEANRPVLTITYPKS